MATNSLHGVEVTFRDTPAPAIRTANLSVIGVIGTAGQGAPNTPTLVRSRGEGTAKFGTSGTLPAALAAIYDQGRPLVVAVNLLDPVADRTAIVATDVADVDGVVQLANTQVSEVAITNAAADTTYTPDTDYTLDASAGTITRLASNSTWDEGDALKATYKWLDPSLVVATDAIGSATGSSYTGMFAMLAAQGVTGYRPRILCAPGWTQVAATAQAMLPVADQLQATLVADGPSTSDADALAYRQAFDSRRIFIVDPRTRIAESVLEWSSARAAGLIAQVSARDGFWRSPSNHALQGVLGTERPVDYSSLATSRANHLNSNQIATVIRLDQGGFRLWGNRVASSDARWKFLSVARTTDAIEDALERSFLWAVDKGLRATFFEDVSEAVNAYLRDLQGRGAILGGSCAPADPSLNSAENIADGESYFDLEFTPVAPAEKISFRVAITNERYAQLAGGQ